MSRNFTPSRPSSGAFSADLELPLEVKLRYCTHLLSLVCFQRLMTPPGSTVGGIQVRSDTGQSLEVVKPPPPRRRESTATQEAAVISSRPECCGAGTWLLI